jgi:hypothetical protein
MMNSQPASRDSSADPTGSIGPAPPPSSHDESNPLWFIAAAMAFFFALAAAFLAAG